MFPIAGWCATAVGLLHIISSVFSDQKQSMAGMVIHSKYMFVEREIKWPLRITDVMVVDGLMFAVKAYGTGVRDWGTLVG